MPKEAFEKLLKEHMREREAFLKDFVDLGRRTDAFIKQFRQMVDKGEYLQLDKTFVSALGALTDEFKKAKERMREDLRFMEQAENLASP